MKNVRRVIVGICALLWTLPPGSGAARQLPRVEGYWTGNFQENTVARGIALWVVRADDGVHLGRVTFTEPMMPVAPSRVDEVVVGGRSVRFRFQRLGAAFEATLAGDGSTLAGTWTDAGGKTPLTLRRSLPPQPTPHTPLDVPLDVKVPVTPTPFAGGAQRHTAYELHIANVASTVVRVQRLEVLSGESVLAAYEGVALNDVLSWPGQPVADNRRLEPWAFRVAWIWLSQPVSAAPLADLRHRLVVDGQTTITEPVRVNATGPPVLGPPLKGGVWIALQGPGPDSMHRRSLMPIGGRLRIPQRFGVDWIRAVPGPDAGTASYGAEVLAVADGTVVDVTDGIPDNTPGSGSRAVPITRDTVGGNVVVLDIGGGHHVFYAHLQTGIAVKKGGVVKRGQVLGRIGNSGDSGGPHLHFHVMDAADFGEGVPFLLDRWEAVAGVNAGPRTRVSPMNGARVRFPD